MRKMIKKVQTLCLLFGFAMLVFGIFQSNVVAAIKTENIESIVFGLYGDLNSKHDKARIEVTDQLKNMLKNGKIKKGNISKVFKVDPVKGDHKGLFVIYIKDDQMFCSIKDGKDNLVIPDKSDMRIFRGKSQSSDLQILKALYGDFNRPKGKKIVIDVTGKVRGLVHNNAIEFTGKNSKYNDLFGDPAKGIKKGLFVAYRVNDKMYLKILGEDEKNTISASDHKDTYQVYTFGKRAVQPAVVPVSIVAPQPVTAAASGSALEKFTQGTTVVLMSYADEERPRLLQVGKGGHLVPKGLEPQDQSTHFIVHRDGNWITLKSAVTGDVIQVLPRLHMVRLAKEGAKEWSQWSAEFDDPSNAYGFVYLKNRASGGYLSAPAGKWTLGRMWTTLKERVGQALDKGAALPSSEPAPKSKDGRLKLFIADDLIKQMDKKKSLPEKVVDKVVDVVRELEPLNAIPGGKEFTYSPIIHRLKTKYHDNWKFSTPGSGHVVFEARAKNRMIVTFSGVPRDLDNGMYYVSIGHENNTRSGIRKSTSGKMLFEKDIAQGASKDVVVTGGLPEDGSRYASYWIKVDQGTVTFGKGRIVGENEQMRWTDADPLKLVSYVGFGGGKLNSVHYKNIEIGSGLQVATKPAREAVLPAEFSSEGVRVQDIAAGMRNGQLELFAVIGNELHYRERGSMKVNPWVKITTPAFTKVRRVAVGPRDGSLFVTTTDGKVFKYIWPTATPAQAAVVTPVAPAVTKLVKKKASKKRSGKKKTAQRSGKKKGAKKSARKKTTKKASKKTAKRKKTLRKKVAKKNALTP